MKKELTLEERIKRATAEEVSIVPYDPAWVKAFEAEKAHLLACLPGGLVGRIEHFGSTAIPGLSAKPVIDILVEVRSLEETKAAVVPILEAQGYEYFWRPSFGDDVPPFYAWFIKRNPAGARTHHIHMIESGFEMWDRLYFRDYLIIRPDCALRYEILKLGLVREYPNDRVAYTKGKTQFIAAMTRAAKEYFENFSRKNKND